MTTIVGHFEQTALQDMQLSSQVVIASGTSVRDTVMAMANADTSCAFIKDGDRLIGIFTEHDVTHRVVASPDVWEQPVENFMTPEPHVIAREHTAMDALRVMRTGGFRNLPVVLDDEGRHANVTHYDLIRLASRFMEDVSVDDEEFSAEHALRYVNFYGMPSRVPVEVNPDDTLATVIGLMKTMDRGLVSIVDERGVLIGEFTQHDIFRKVACRVDDLEDHLIGDWMTTSWASALPSATIMDGLHEMAAKRHRYVMLTNETGRSVGVVNFRDIADYLDAAFTAN